MFNRTLFKKRILFVGIPDMAYIGLDGLLMSGVNIECSGLKKTTTCTMISKLLFNQEG